MLATESTGAEIKTDSRKCQTATATPAEPGDLPIRISPVEAPKQKCSCAVVAPRSICVLVIGIDSIHSYGIATRNSDLSDRNQHPSGCELSVLTWSRCCDRAA